MQNRSEMPHVLHHCKEKYVSIPVTQPYLGLAKCYKAALCLLALDLTSESGFATAI